MKQSGSKRPNRSTEVIEPDEIAENTVFKFALRACRTAVYAVIFFSMLINLLMLTAPLYMLQVFDRVLHSYSSETLLFLTIIAGVAFIALALLEAVRGLIMVRLARWIDEQTATTLLRGNIQAGLALGWRMPVTGLRDLETFRSFLTGPGVIPILDAPWTPLFLVVIFVLHPLLGWLAIGGACVLVVFALLNERLTRSRLQLATQGANRAIRDAETSVRNADAIEAMAMMPNVLSRWQAQNGDVLDLQSRASTDSGFIRAGAKFVRLFLQVAMLGAGAWLVLQGDLTPGAMIAASILLGRAYAPIDMAIGSWRSAVAARSAYHRVAEQVAATPERGMAMQLPAPTGLLEAVAVTFAHRGQSDPVIRGVSFRLEPGESLGLIGPTAAGKTTLSRMLVGNLRPIRGTIRLDSADVASWDPDARGRYVGYLPQDVELFPGTVWENIARLGECDSDAVVSAASLAGVHELILRLPDGYETEIGAGGAVLSGGQRQRIALARALFGNPKLVVLDEPNANLDQAGELALVETMERLRENKITAVVVAHRPSILRSVDKILVLKDGMVDAFGARDEIMPRFIAPTAAPTNVQSGGV